MLSESRIQLQQHGLDVGTTCSTFRASGKSQEKELTAVRRFRCTVYPLEPSHVRSFAKRTRASSDGHTPYLPSADSSRHRSGGGRKPSPIFFLPRSATRKPRCEPAVLDTRTAYPQERGSRWCSRRLFLLLFFPVFLRPNRKWLLPPGIPSSSRG